MLETVTIYRTWTEIAASLPTDDARGKFYHALCEYSLYGKEPELEGELKAYFMLMRPSIDKSNKRKLTQRNRSQNRWQNSSQTSPQTEPKPCLQESLQTPQTEPQPCLQESLQTDPQTELQNGCKSVYNTDTDTDTDTEKEKEKKIEKKTVPDGTAKETAVSFVDRLPEHLQTPAFRKKWIEWEQFRRKRKRKPVSECAARLQFQLLEQFDESTAAQIIDSSIANDYQGLFPPRNRPLKNTGKDYTGI